MGWLNVTRGIWGVLTAYALIALCAVATLAVLVFIVLLVGFCERLPLVS